MPISVCCPKCGKRSNAQESAIGKKAKCGKCSAVFVVAASIATVEQPPVMAVSPEPPAISYAQAPSPASFIPGPSRPLHNGPSSVRSMPRMPLFVVTALAALVLIGGTAYWMGRSVNVTSVSDNLNLETFRAVNRASKAMEGASSVGVNQAKFRDPLQSFATEVALLEGSKLTAPEKSCLALFREAQATYADSLAIWELKGVEKGLLGSEHLGLNPDGTLEAEPWKNKVAPTMILVDGPLTAIVAKHKLPLVPTNIQAEYGTLKLTLQAELKMMQFKSLPRGEQLFIKPSPLLKEGDAERIRNEKYIVDTAVQTLWTKAKATSDQASSLLD